MNTKNIPRLSVVIPLYNGARFIAETINSILGQRYENLEVIVVDDGSSDDSAARARACGSQVVLLSQKNAGQAIARNRGLEAAQGSIIGFCDQDDLWTEGRLNMMLPYLSEGKDCDYVRGKTLEFGELASKDAVAMYREPLIGACLFRAEVFDRVGFFNAEMRAGEDFDWSMRLRESDCKEKRVEGVTFLYRRHSANHSNTPGFIATGQFHALRNKLKRTHIK